jgi:two-component sensor histidine kinase
VLTIIVFWSNVQKRISVAFVLYMVAMFFWQFTALMVSLSHDAAQATTWYRLMTAGLAGYPIFYAFFTQVFTKKKFSPMFLVTGWLVYLSLIGIGITDLVIQSVSRESSSAIFIPAFGLLVPIVGVVYFVFAGYTLVTLIRSLRTETGDVQHTRIVYLLTGFVITAVGTISNLIPIFQSVPIDVAGATLNAILIAYAIVKYKLLDLKTVIRISLRYSIPTVVIGTAYFLLISLVDRVFHLVSGENIFFFSVIVAVLAAIAFQPFRDRVQVFIDKTFFREKYDTSLMLQRVSENATLLLDNLDNLSQMIVGEVTKTLHLEKMGFCLKKAETGELILIRHSGEGLTDGMCLRADHPLVRWLTENKRALTMNEIEMIPVFKSLWKEERESLYNIGAEIFVPVKAKGELAGFFFLGRKLSGKQYTEEDTLVLGMLANQTAVGIENARLYWEKEETLRELKETHAELENRVRERTKDLAVANEKLTDALREKEILMREIHHRVKNNLQIISSLLKLQTRNATRENVVDILNATENRVRSIALVHEHLYSSQNLTNIDFSSYIRSIVRYLADTYGAELRNIKIEVRSEEIQLDIGRAIPCGIIINELITNALKYAFTGKNGGIITIVFRSIRSGEYYLEIADNGQGLVKDFRFEDTTSLGFKIVHTLASQLKTNLDIKRENGTSISMVIPPN